MWETRYFQDLTIDDFKFLEYVKNKPDYLIISSGKDMKMLDPKIRKYLHDTFDLNVDVLDYFLATGTYNSCMEENTNVMIFICLE